jgi:hypothetical protein
MFRHVEPRHHSEPVKNQSERPESPATYRSNTTERNPDRSGSKNNGTGA